MEEGVIARGEERVCLSRVAGRQPLIHVLAAAGLGKRVRCAGMVRGGRIAVEGRIVRDLQARADPFREQITLDGEPIPLTNVCRYVLFNKPYGVLSAASDPEGRPTVADYVDVPGDYAVGRLDLDSEGLMLLTDDGWLIHRLGHSQFGHPRTYVVQVDGVPDTTALRRLVEGVTVKGEYRSAAEVELLANEPEFPSQRPPVQYQEARGTAWLRLVLTEGRKHQVRHMTAAIGHPTLRLVRVSIGPLKLGQLRPGEWRSLTPQELDALRATLHTPGRGRQRR
jgi:23S rRNA pseudouridine2457 synthase